eukprot:gene25739-31085_t
MADLADQSSLQVVVREEGECFLLSICYENCQLWQITRSAADCHGFVDRFKHFMVDCDDASSLQACLNYILRRLGSQVWSTPFVLQFLDTTQTQSPLTTLKLQLMEKKVDYLVQLVGKYESRLADIEEKNSRLASLLTMHLNNLREKPVVPSNGATAEILQQDHHANGAPPMEPSAQSGFISPLLLANQVPIVDENDGEGSISDLSIPSNKASTNADAGAESQAAPLAAFFQVDAPAPVAVAWGSLESDNDAAIGQDGCITAAMQEVLSHLSPCSAEAEFAVDAIVKLVQPHESQIVYRDSAVNFVKRQIKFALNALSFETAFVDLRCFLPGDPLCLTVIVPQNQLSIWQVSLMDRFKLIIDAMMEGRYRPADDNVEDNGKAPIRHNMRSLSLQPADVSGNKVVFVIDAIEVQVSVNNRLDLCMSTFLEEFDARVGSGHVFKRSLLLLRAWWVYESLAYAGSGVTQMKHYLSDQALAIMLVAIFNRYVRHIKSPLHALILFFAEYENYDPETSVVTLQGIVPFSGTSSLPSLESVQKYHLVDTEMIEKFWQLFNVDSQPTEQIGAARPTSPGARHRNLFNSMAKASEKFERSGFNVLHPFTHANMVPEKSTPKNMGVLKQIFQSALHGVTSALNAVKENDSLANEIMGRYFPSVLGRFGSEYRPDAVNQTLVYVSPTPMEEVLKSDVEAMWRAVHFANFIIEYVIMDSAVITFCSDLLMTKGPLPAGEVGKVLSETSCVPQLSHRLREKYGGLKKLLEKYPDIFVFSNDHPFNPHVLLRKTLSQENLELVDRGIFPVHLLTKYSKTQMNSKKATKSVSSGASTSSAANSLSPSPFMREQSQIPAGAIDRAQAMLGNNYPPYMDANSYPSSTSIQPFSNQSAYGGGNSTIPPPNPYAPPGGGSGYSPSYNPRAAAQNRLNSYSNRGGISATTNISYVRPSWREDPRQFPAYDHGNYTANAYPAPRGRGNGHSLDNNFIPPFSAPEQSYDAYSGRAGYPAATRDKAPLAPPEGSLSVLASLRQGNSASGRGFDAELTNPHASNNSWLPSHNSSYHSDPSASSFPPFAPSGGVPPRQNNSSTTDLNQPFGSPGGSDVVSDFHFSSTHYNN